jgi:4-aminobutyrate aminotransferase
MPAKILVEPPGPNAQKIMNVEAEYFTPSHDRLYPLFVKEARGTTIIDVDGNSYVDFAQGSGCVSVGLSHPEIVSEVQRLVDGYAVTGFPYSSELIVKLSEKLATITPGYNPKRVCYGLSGMEAVDGAMRLARWHTRRPQFIAFWGAHHGFTMGASSLSAHYSAQVRGFHPMVPGVVHMPYPYCYRCPFGKKDGTPKNCCGQWKEHLDSLLNTIAPPENVAAIFVEPLQGPGGMVEPPDDFHQHLKKICEQHGIMYVADEILTGLGRTGKMFAIQHWPAVKPDITILGKGLGNGTYPVSAFLANKDVMNWDPGAHTTTYHCHPIGAAVANKVIEIIERDKLADRSARLGDQARKRLREMQAKHELIGDVRGKGLFIGVELVKNQTTKEPASKETMQLAWQAFRRGLILQWNGLKFNVFKMYPSMNIEARELNEGLDLFESTLTDVEQGKVSIPSLPPHYLVQTAYR